ncbi:SBBP repeat-containing protein [bacterium]|nr:SBBP repeat-containing protein [bacterium]
MFVRKLLIVMMVLHLILLSHQSQSLSFTTNQSMLTLSRENAKIILNQSHFFTENKGQWDPPILFAGETSFGKIVFTKDSISYNSITLSFVHPLVPNVSGKGILPHYSNYFIGNNSKKWASNCSHFSKIYYSNLWSGIDLAYFFSPEGLKYEYYIAPEANISDLQIKVNGAELISHKTSLQMATSHGDVMDTNLTVYDIVTKQNIPSHFTVHNSILSFNGIPERRDHTIVIDPLVYSTLIGGSDEDQPTDISIDFDKNIYVCGFTRSYDFPVTPDPYQGEKGANYQEDGFIVKLNPEGKALVYSTYFGGSEYDMINGIQVDRENCIYITGETQSYDFPITKEAYQTSHKGGGSDGFVSKFDANGSILVYSTFMGGSEYEYAQAIAIDHDGNVYITGICTSKDFPVSTDAYQKTNKGKTTIFVSKVDSTGQHLRYSTFLGGSKEDRSYDIEVDKDGNAYVTGETNSPDFPVSSDAYQKSLQGYGDDSFISKVNSTGSKLLYSSYFGGSSDEKGYRIEVDSKGIVYICGITDSYDLPVTPGAFQIAVSSNNTRGDCFIAKLDITSSSLIFSTYLGGSSEDKANGFSVDKDGNTYITGYTTSTDFPVTSSAYRIFNQDSYDAFITKLNNLGTTLIYSTYLGGNSEDAASSSCIDPEGYVYVTGYTWSDDFPVMERNNSQKRVGANDLFITKFDTTKSDFPIDKTPPELTIVSPADNTEVEVSSVIIIVEAYDKETGIQSVTIDGNSVSEDRENKRRYVYQLSLKHLTNTIEITATNRIGLQTKKQLVISRNNPIILELWINKPEAIVDGQKKVLEAPPMIIKKRTLVPVRFISEAFGANVDWNQQEQKISIVYDRITIYMWLTSDKVEKRIKTGERVQAETLILDAPPLLLNNRTLVPIRFLSETFGAQVYWESKSQKVTIILRNIPDPGGEK